MWCNQIFSLLSPQEDNSFIIQNIIVADNYEIANQIACISYGENAIAIDTTLYPVRIGDIWNGERFISVETKEEIPRNTTEAEEIKQLRTELDVSVSNLLDMEYQLCLLSIDSSEEDV